MGPWDDPSWRRAMENMQRLHRLVEQLSLPLQNIRRVIEQASLSQEAMRHVVEDLRAARGESA
jgi:hypothetical protein